MELGTQQDALRKLGYGIAALSYDKPEALAHFAKRKNIGYPLLSDAESKVIQAWGILNEKANGFAKGIPHPGLFIVNGNGIVEAKYFEDDYTERMTVAAILAGRFGQPQPAARGTIDRPRIKLTTSASTGVVKPGQKLRLEIDATLGEGLHAYAPGAVADFIPVRWTIAPSAAVKVQEAQWPTPKQMVLYGSPGKVPAYEGTIKVSREITIGNQRALTSSELEVSGEFRYQACNDKLCYPPETIPVSWKLLVEGHDRERVPKELQRQ